MFKAEQGPLAALYDELRTGRISRRDFLQRAAALGVGMPVVLYLLNGVPSAAAQSASGTPAATGANGRADSGTQNQQRGAGGELRIYQWQAATLLNPQAALGVKDVLAAQPVLEPLMVYLPDGKLGPALAKDVPTLDNGMLAKDYTSVTYNLVEGVKWSDGEPFTADDVVFTWQWIMKPENSSVNFETYKPIKNVEAVNPTQVKITFSESRLDWYVPFSGYSSGSVLPKHVLEKGGSANDTFRSSPIGTGPYKVDSFKAGDQVIYSINDNYREPNKPYFAKINMKGGGEASQAARAVLQTGDWDYAWNMQIEPQLLNSMANSGKGHVLTSPGAGAEAVYMNFSDPNKETDGQRSYYKNPHPFFTDKTVRQALSLATDREGIAKQLYQQPGEPATANVMLIPPYVSKNTSFEFDVDKANKTLEDAGWKKQGDVRAKDGVELKLVYGTSINSVRQKEQAINKQNWEKAGFKVQLKNIDAGTYFDTGAGNEQSIYHFYRDIDMYTNQPSSPYPLPYMQTWYSGGGDSARNVAQAANNWSGLDLQRYINPDYDKLYEAAGKELDPEKFADLIIQMNDLLANDVAIIPLVQRANVKAAVSNKLNAENIAPGAIEFDYWNIANWNEAQK
jgi:peptide/nickel transport system substrate-binding protein